MSKSKAPEAWNKGRKLPAEPLSANEVIRLIGQCSKRAPSGVRNAAMLAVMWRGGLPLLPVDTIGCTPKASFIKP